jgi:hypothetical protein
MTNGDAWDIAVVSAPFKEAAAFSQTPDVLKERKRRQGTIMAGR